MWIQTVNGESGEATSPQTEGYAMEVFYTNKGEYKEFKDGEKISGRATYYFDEDGVNPTTIQHVFHKGLRKLEGSRYYFEFINDGEILQLTEDDFSNHGDISLFIKKK